MFPCRISKLRFGLKSLFALMLGIAIGFGLSKWPVSRTGTGTPAWNALGLNLSVEPQSTFDGSKARYRAGMHVNRVRPNSPAGHEGIVPGDVIVGIHNWEITSEQDIDYALSQANLRKIGKLKFYILRGQNTLFGHLNVAAAD